MKAICRRCLVIAALACAPGAFAFGSPATQGGLSPHRIAWGMPVDGIQIGLSAPKYTFVVPAPIRVDVWIRNTSRRITIGVPADPVRSGTLSVYRKYSSIRGIFHNNGGAAPVWKSKAPPTKFGAGLISQRAGQSAPMEKLHLTHGQRLLYYKFVLNKISDMSSGCRYRVRLGFPLRTNLPVESGVLTLRTRARSLPWAWATNSARPPSDRKLHFGGAVRGIQVAFSAPHQKFAVCDPIILRVWLRNTTGTDVRLPLVLSQLNFTPVVADPRGSPIGLTEAGFAFFHPISLEGQSGQILLAPRRVRSFGEFVPNQLFDMSVPGKYTVSIKFPVPTKPHYGSAKEAISNTLHITVSDSVPGARPKGSGPVKKWARVLGR